MKKIETWLPCFSGFYNTIWDNGESLRYDTRQDFEEVDYLIGLLKVNKIEDIDNFINETLWNNVDSKGRDNDIVKSLSSYVEDVLIDLKLIKSLKFGKLCSPAYYNFSNDSAGVEIVLTAENVRNIHEYIDNNRDKFFEHIKSHYTSYDRFWSDHSNYASNWIDKDNEEYFLNESHKLGAVLQFILMNEYDDFEVNSYYEIEHYESEYVNYEGMITDWLKYKTIKE